jgi:hypothetical protein
MGAATLQICLRFCKATARRFARDSGISTAASMRLYSKDVKSRVFVCYMSSIVFPI